MSESELKPIWKENYRIRSFEIDINARLRISSLCSFFQEIAGKHAEHLGVGYLSMKDSGMVWMLSRLYIEIHNYPEWEDDISIETWPTGMERLFFRRDFHVLKKQKRIVSAVSYWLALDLKSLRPRVFQIDDKVTMANKDRFAMYTSVGNIPSPTGGNLKLRDIRYSELDQNRHVNNTRYIEWIMDQFEIKRLDESMPHFFGIEYKHEVKENQVVQIRSAPEPANKDIILLEGVIESSGQVCFRSKIAF